MELWTKGKTGSTDTSAGDFYIEAGGDLSQDGRHRAVLLQAHPHGDAGVLTLAALAPDTGLYTAFSARVPYCTNSGAQTPSQTNV